MSGRRVDEYTIMISWTPLTLRQSRGVVTGYSVGWAEYDGTFTQSYKWQPVSADATSYTVSTGIIPSKQYSINIFAINKIGNGPSLDEKERPVISSKIIFVYIYISVNY